MVGLFGPQKIVVKLGEISTTLAGFGSRKYQSVSGTVAMGNCDISLCYNKKMDFEQSDLDPL